LQKIIMLVYGWVNLGVLWLISGVIFWQFLKFSAFMFICLLR
jgi:hypothetical protein